jgi:hypothetical protein
MDVYVHEDSERALNTAIFFSHSMRAAGHAFATDQRCGRVAGDIEEKNQGSDKMFKKLSTLLAAGAFVAVLMPAAHALTPAPIAGIAIDNAAADIIQVAQGCGRGFHRSRYGRCVPNLGPRRAVCRTVWTSHGRRTVCRR